MLVFAAGGVVSLQDDPAPPAETPDAGTTLTRPFSPPSSIIDAAGPRRESAPEAGPEATDTGASFSFEVAALGGLAVDTEPGVVVGLGQLNLRGGLGRWGLLLDLGFEANRIHRAPPVTTAASTQWLSLSFSVAFQPLDWLSLDVALGVRGWRLSAATSGLGAVGGEETFTAGGVLSAGLHVRLLGPLHFTLRPQLSLRARRVDFAVAPELPIEPVTFGALAGLRLRFE